MVRVEFEDPPVMINCFDPLPEFGKQDPVPAMGLHMPGFQDQGFFVSGFGIFYFPEPVKEPPVIAKRVHMVGVKLQDLLEQFPGPFQFPEFRKYRPVPV